MAQHLKSSEVKVFPFGTTRATDPNGRIFNEQNLAQFVRNVTDKHSYVLSFNDNILEFVIDGYYFKSDVSSLLSSTSAGEVNIYAFIRIVSSDGFKYLDGNDESDSSEESRFTGVSFVTDLADITDGASSLHVLVKNDSSTEYNVPEESLARFNDTALFDINTKIQNAVDNAVGDSLNIDVINCGSSTEVIW